jgi:anti-sigma B factor antagonist
MPQLPLSIEETVNSGDACRILRLNGPIIISNLFDLQAKIRANNTQCLIIDLTDVPYVDSAGIGALVGAYVTHNKEGRSLALVGVCERVMNALKVTKVESFFRFYDSVASAQASLN